MKAAPPPPLPSAVFLFSSNSVIIHPSLFSSYSSLSLLLDPFKLFKERERESERERKKRERERERERETQQAATTLALDLFPDDDAVKETAMMETAASEGTRDRDNEAAK